MTEAEKSEQFEGTAAADHRAMVMFVVAIAFLAVFAAILPHGGLAEAVSDILIGHPVSLVLLAGLWAAIIVEGILRYLAAPDKPKNAIFRLLLVVVIPPMRMTISPRRPNDKVWLPRLGWLSTGKDAVETMEVRTAMPMLVMTTLIIPVIAADVLTGPRVHDVLAKDLETVTRYDLSDSGMRLFMMDENERVIANVARSDRSVREGLDGCSADPKARRIRRYPSGWMMCSAFARGVR